MSGDELLERIKKDGWESLGVYPSLYPGVVEDAADPDKSGRVKFKCPDVLGKEISDWAEIRGIASGDKFGVFFPVEKGDRIWCSFRGGNPRAPMYEAGWFTKGNVPGTDFCIITRAGQKITFNQKDDSIIAENKAGFHVELLKTGVVVKGPSGDLNAVVLGDEFAKQWQKLLTKLSTTIAGGFPLSTAADFASMVAEIQLFLSKNVKTN